MASRRAVIAGGAGAAVLAAFGYRAWDRGLFSAGAGPAFEPWSDWQGHAGEGIERPLHAAILAANPHDTQPWLFVPLGDTITVLADRTRHLGTFDPFRREMHLGIGCALVNLVLAANAFSFEPRLLPAAGRLTLSPGPKPVIAARARLTPRESNENPLLKHIPKRHTHRGPYRSTKPDGLQELANLVSDKDCRVVLVTDPGAREDMRRIIIKATEVIISDRQMSADSARWFRTGRREIELHRDGVTTDTAGISPWLAAAAKLMPDQDAKSADQYWLSTTRDVQTATAPVFGMILLRDRFDMPRTLAAGMAWQQLHLLATAKGLAAQPMNQPVEMMDRNVMLGRTDTFRPALAKLAKLPGWEPTFVFRMGYAERDALPSPRRPLSDVVIRRA